VRIIALLVLVVGCTVTPPQPPVPPVPPPDNAVGTCETAAANARRLGGCDLDMGTFQANCEDAARAEQGVRLALPTGCLTVARTCGEMWRCR
jgi:hypothetical protein